MIKNEKQLRITKAALRDLEQGLERLKAHIASGGQDGRIHPRLQQAQVDAVQSEIEILREQVADYEQLQQGTRLAAVELAVIEQIPRALIEARIAAGLTQKELAEALGLKHQQVQRYEATDYASASLQRVREVADVLTTIQEQGRPALHHENGSDGPSMVKARKMAM